MIFTSTVNVIPKTEKKKDGAFSEGDRVKHKIFGEGTVLSVTEMSSDTLVEVNFDKVGVKKLMTNFAKLTKV